MSQLNRDYAWMNWTISNFHTGHVTQSFSNIRAEQGRIQHLKLGVAQNRLENLKSVYVWVGGWRVGVGVFYLFY